MRLDHLTTHARLTRRDVLALTARAGVVAGLASVGLRSERAHAALQPTPPPDDDPSDEMFDVEAVENGAWVPGPYGPDDQRGSFNEVTPAKTAAALAMLAPGRPVATYNLGDLLFNGYPAYVIAPPRVYDQRLTVLGYPPPPSFFAEGGILQSAVPLGPNRISAHEERFPLGGTYQIATQLDNLNHIGVGAMFYNGFTGPDIAAGHGTLKLGNEHMGPLVTRGMVLDILGLKLATGADDALSETPDGQPILHDDYRITLEDIRAALARQGNDEPGPGDVVLFRTGWHLLARSDPQRYLANEPGIYLREARWLGARRPAIIGSDTWALETLDEEVNGGNFFPVHQELFMRFGIRIGEGIITDSLVADGIYDFVYITTPQFAAGATAGNAPPAALAQPSRVPEEAPQAREAPALPTTGGGAAAGAAAVVAARSLARRHRA